MGLDRKVLLKSNPTPAWASWTTLLAQRQLSVQIRMIDGQLAFPDEIPDDTWQELRVGLPACMLTLRREPDGIRVVTWGNASPDALREWKMTIWAIAKAGEGEVESDSGPQSADEFAGAEQLGT